MPTQKKAAIIDDLEQVFAKCKVGVLTNYRGIPAPEMSTLRRKLKSSGVDYRVVKNTLALIAAKRTGKKNLSSLFVGQTALACGYEEDVVGPVKVLMDNIRTARMNLEIKGGFLGERLLSAADVRSLAELPSKEQLIAMVVGGFQSPIAAFVGQLSAPISGLVGVLQARIQQLGGEAK